MNKPYYSIGGTLFAISGLAVIYKKGRFSNSGYCLIGVGTSLFINGRINEEIAIPDANTNHEECLRRSQKICKRLLMNTSLAIASDLLPFSLNFINISERNRKIFGCVGTICSSFALSQLLDMSLHLSNLKQTIIQTRASFQRAIDDLQNGNRNNNQNQVGNVYVIFGCGFGIGCIATISIKLIYNKFRRLK